MMNGKKMISYSSGIKYVKTPEGVESEAFQARSKNGETEMLLKTKDNKLLLIQSENDDINKILSQRSMSEPMDIQLKKILRDGTVDAGRKKTRKKKRKSHKKKKRRRKKTRKKRRKRRKKKTKSILSNLFD